MAIPVGCTVHITRVMNGYRINVESPDHGAKCQQVGMYTPPPEYVCMEDDVLEVVKLAVVNAQIA